MKGCAEDGCAGRHYALGQCVRHYGASRRRIRRTAVVRVCPVCRGDLSPDRRLGSVYCDRACNRRAVKIAERFGLSPEGYWTMLSEQDDACGGCGTTDPGPRTFFDIDHDHDTGKVRGLLCRQCNLAVGYAQDDPPLLRALADYLEER
jgi:hypothetical protein